MLISFSILCFDDKIISVDYFSYITRIVRRDLYDCGAEFIHSITEFIDEDLIRIFNGINVAVKSLLSTLTPSEKVCL